MHRNFQNFLWESTPRTPLITIYIVLFCYPPLLLKWWEDNDPNNCRQVGGGLVGEPTWKKCFIKGDNWKVAGPTQTIH